MGTYGHADLLLNQIADTNERAAWSDMLSRPFPKLLQGYTDAYYVSFNLKSAGVIPSDMQWREQMGVTAANQPVEGEMYMPFRQESTVGHVSSARIQKYMGALDRMQEELKQVDCPVAVVHHRVVEGEKLIDQYGLFHPVMKPNTDRTGWSEDRLTVHDVEGSNRFLAYLLYKGKVKPSDIPKGGAESRFLEPFGQQVLSAARSPHYQEMMEEGLKTNPGKAEEPELAAPGKRSR